MLNSARLWLFVRAALKPYKHKLGFQFKNTFIYVLFNYLQKNRNVPFASFQYCNI